MQRLQGIDYLIHFSSYMISNLVRNTPPNGGQRDDRTATASLTVNIYREFKLDSVSSNKP